MRKKLKIFFIFLTVSLSLSVFFANCADVKIGKNPPLEVSSLTKPNVSLCSYADTQKLTDDLKVSFIVDMSGSNIRNTVRPGTTSVIKPTDPVGDRLAAIGKFIDAHPNVSYRIIPFSSQIINNMACSSPFVSAGAAAILVNNLKSLQAFEVTAANPADPSMQMKETMYNIALKCAADALTAEPVGGATPFQYKFFFVTDGEPTDYTEVSAMEQTVGDMQLISLAKRAASLQFIPVFYGSEPSTRAVETLKRIGKAGLWKNSSTPTDPTSPLLVNSVNQLDFDRLLSFTITQQFRITEFNIVNLTAILENGKLLADSDMDGVPDIRDNNPTLRRSNAAGLLDGICEKLGGPGFCVKPANCSVSLSNPGKLSQCDAVALGLSKIGWDEDGDGIPDFIEFLRGTNPVVDDALGDMDNDGENNLSEIHQGSAVDNPQRVDNQSLNLWSRILTTATSAGVGSDASRTCPANQDSWNIEVSQIPLVRVQAYSDPFDQKWPTGDIFPLSHAEDENVIFVYYFQQSANSSKSGRQLRGKIIKLKMGGATALTVSPADFVDFGDPEAQPVWK